MCSSDLSHQLRVACASLGTPLLGDLKYGAAAPLEDRSIALHATRLRIPHPTRPGPLEVEAAPPAGHWWWRTPQVPASDAASCEGEVP